MEIFFPYNEIETEALEPGISRKVLAHDTNMMAVEVSFDKGCRGAAHTHPHEQISYVLEGAFEFTVGGESRIVTAGDTLFMASGVLHGTVCLEKGRVLDVFTPQREDFLK